MALNKTTLSSAMTTTSTTAVVASATGAAANGLLKVDDEVMLITKSYVSGTTIPVLRGQDGTLTAAHPASANAIIFLATDEPGATAQTSPQWPLAGRNRSMLSYSAAGAITLPSPGQDMLAVINGTSTLAMTLANPTTDMDGCMLIICSNGKGAHTVTYAAGVGIGGASMDVGTYNTTEATGCILIALNGFWLLIGNGIGSSGTQVAGVVWA